ncbi:MAG: hypothetical protein C5B59_06770 [Bacteroidetes bacterium]|nr:MAG: hypothetical protein C5B59_06770 [Bacteroidota bacterium]
MNVKQAVALIRKHGPSTPEEFTEIGVPLEKRKIGSGIFREVIKVKGLPLVVKFPIAESKNGRVSYRAGKMHSTVEVKKIARLRKFRKLRGHLPTVYYHDRKSGVLVMQYYPAFVNDADTLRALGKMVTKAISHGTGIEVSDIHEENVRMGKTSKHAVLIDLGY